jgi:Tfp pilus assembly protein PilO
MRARLESLSGRTITILAVGTVVVYAAAIWFLLVSPKRSEAATARGDLAAAEVRLVEARVAGTRPRSAGAPVADVFRLAKAMPASADQPGLVFELSRLARQSGVTLRSVTPLVPVAEVGGPTVIPLTVTLGGSYRKITNFLSRTRNLVTVRDGKIHARGRLLDVRTVTLIESVTDGFPKLDATVGMFAYVYDGPIVPAELPQLPEEGEEPASTDGTSAAAGSMH